MSDTPRTDANDLGWQFNEQHGDFDSLSDNPMPWLDFAKMLERELDAVTEQRDAVTLRLGKTQERMIDAERQRDRLAEAMRHFMTHGGHYQPVLRDTVANIAKEALQSLTPNEL